MFRIKKYAAPILLVAMLLVVAGIEFTNAVTTRNLSSQVDGKRYRVTYTDIQAAPMVNGDPAVRRLVLFTLAPGQQLVSFVSKVTTGFVLPNEGNVYIRKIRAEQNGVEVSRGNLAYPPELTFPIFENRAGDNFEFAIYSEDVATEIVLYIESGDQTTLNNLTAGSADFLVTIFK